MVFVSDDASFVVGAIPCCLLRCVALKCCQCFSATSVEWLLFCLERIEFGCARPCNSSKFGSVIGDVFAECSAEGFDFGCAICVARQRAHNNETQTRERV
jgi:hypothetical protein